MSSDMEVEYPPSHEKTEPDSLGVKIAGGIFLTCIIVLAVAGTVRALMWMFA